MSLFIKISEIVLFISFLCGFFSGAAAGGEQPFEKIRIAYSSISGETGPLWMAIERGLFRKYGLDAEILFFPGDRAAAQRLISGRADFAHMAGIGAVQSRLEGADVAIIAGFINALAFQLVVDNTIRQPEQLRAKLLGVAGYGSSTDFVTRYALDKWGLAPHRDVTILDLGSMPALLAGLESGRIQGAMLSPPFDLVARRRGYFVLADLRALGLDYQHTALSTTRFMIKSKPGIVRRVMKAYVEGVRTYRSNAREAMAVLSRYFGTNDVEILKEAYETVALGPISDKLYPTLRGIQIMLWGLSASDPRARTASPEEFVDLGFVTELDRSGFMDMPLGDEAAVPADAVSGEITDAPSKEAKPPKPVVNAPRELVYTVKAGDSLSRLAARFYGSHDQWVKIYESNKRSVKSPNHILIGQKIVIPNP